MAEDSIFTHQEAEFLRELLRQKVDFMIVGLSAAALQGAPVVTQDVDLWFRDLGDPGIQTALQKVKGTYVSSVGTNPPMFVGKAVNLFDIVLHMHGLGPFDKEIRHCLQIPLGRVSVPVLSLDRIIKSKRATGRQKDKLVLPVLADTLVVIKERAKKRQEE